MIPANSDHGRELLDQMSELDRRERAAREAMQGEIIPPTGGLNRPDIAIRGENYRHARKPEMAGGCLHSFMSLVAVGLFVAGVGAWVLA